MPTISDRVLNKIWMFRYYHRNANRFIDIWRLKYKTIAPNLFIIGAQKSGTSSLHNYLNEHPDIHMSSPLKEPGYYVHWKTIQSYYKAKNRYFSNRGELLKKGILRGYRGQYVIGDSSTFYSNGEHNISKESLLADGLNLAAIKIIYCIRNPFDRIRSHYLHACRNNEYTGDLDTFVKSNAEAIEIIRYGKQLQSYNYLKRSQFHIVPFKQLVTNPHLIMNELFDFIGVPRITQGNFRIYNEAPKEQRHEKSQLQYGKSAYNQIAEAMYEDRMILDDYVDTGELRWSEDYNEI